MIDEIEKKAVTALFPFMGNEPIIIDCGSNKGHWSDIILEEFNGNCELHLIEPIHKLLSFTQVKYEYRRNVTYHPILAYKKDVDKLEFHYFDNFNNEISSIYDGKKDWDGLPKKTTSIVARTIDTLCKDLCIDWVDYLKIDCEGADMDVLNGCACLLASSKIGVVQIEFSSHWVRSGYSFVDLINLAKKIGYSVYRYEESNFVEELNVNSVTDNYFLTKYEIKNYSTGWNKEFAINTFEFPKCGLVLEIGSFEGLNTRYICEKLLLDNPDARVMCIDPLEDHYIPGDTEHPYFRNQYQRFLRNTRGLPVELKRGLSGDELPKLNAFRFDLIYVDGDHREVPVYFDACWAFAICKERGCIIFDDYEWREETKAGIDKFLNEFSGFYDLVEKSYQVVIRKVTNKYNELTQSYY